MTFSTRERAPAGKNTPARGSSPATARLLQRRCACGGSGGSCEECRKNRLQRRASAAGPAPDAAPHIDEVIGGAGKPLDGAVRSFFEQGFGHDFSAVRIHDDDQAARSVRDVGALAYTLGPHVAFDRDRYAPHSSDGRHLLAHELAHVVQQSRGTAGAAPDEARLEREADAAADSVLGSERTVVAGAAAAGVQRKGKDDAKKAPPAPKAPTKDQQDVIDKARRAAAIRTQIAMHRVRGIVPPGPEGRIDPALVMRLRARNLARLMFDWESPNMDQVGDVLGSMVTTLTSGVDVLVGGKDDPACGNRAAYVRGLRPPIVLCPAFFKDSPEQQVRTMIHESAHLARIGSADLGEGYCITFDCAAGCPGGFDSADSWAQFVHCLSDQKPDKPDVVEGKGPKAKSSGSRPGSEK